MAPFWHDVHLAPSYTYARAITRHYARSFYFASRFLPAEKRWATWALYGFCRYADNLIDLQRTRSREELLSELACLSGEISLAYRTGESEHPILKCFIDTARRYQIPERYAQELIKGVEMDVTFNGYASYDDLHLFAWRVAGVVGLMMTYLLGYRDESAFPYAEKLGIAMQLTNILRDIHEDKELGRIYIPVEEMQRFGVAQEDLLAERMTPQLRALMEFQVQRASACYAEAEPGIALLDRDSRFAIYTASRLYQEILNKIVLAGYNPFAGRAFVPSSQKLAILLQEYARRR
ncbi:MAG TPA: phytoene/squalene synthase family protein [bacterium]|nr:phytoene/squalene synthase family protein [bacterium]HQG44445.1 phytoene/squalene synthase family protein [bacterium]HQI48681.1 phytoene/squalene synthase family protein [bacterium]HQJ65010.1 phytoene/squalene synthase family protein [bacterium]